MLVGVFNLLYFVGAGEWLMIRYVITIVIVAIMFILLVYLVNALVV